MNRPSRLGVLAGLAAGVLSVTVSGCAALGMDWDRRSLIEAASLGLPLSSAKGEGCTRR
jgi:hypothetical protein